MIGKRLSSKSRPKVKFLEHLFKIPNLECFVKKKETIVKKKQVFGIMSSGFTQFSSFVPLGQTSELDPELSAVSIVNGYFKFTNDKDRYTSLSKSGSGEMDNEGVDLDSDSLGHYQSIPELPSLGHYQSIPELPSRPATPRLDKKAATVDAVSETVVVNIDEPVKVELTDETKSQKVSNETQEEVGTKHDEAKEERDLTQAGAGKHKAEGEAISDPLNDAENTSNQRQENMDVADSKDYSGLSLLEYSKAINDDVKKKTEESTSILQDVSGDAIDDMEVEIVDEDMNSRGYISNAVEEIDSGSVLLDGSCIESYICTSDIVSDCETDDNPESIINGYTRDVDKANDINSGIGLNDSSVGTVNSEVDCPLKTGFNSDLGIGFNSEETAAKERITEQTNRSGSRDSSGICSNSNSSRGSRHDSVRSYMQANSLNNLGSGEVKLPVVDEKLKDRDIDGIADQSVGKLEDDERVIESTTHF